MSYRRREFSTPRLSNFALVWFLFKFSSVCFLLNSVEGYRRLCKISDASIPSPVADPFSVSDRRSTPWLNWLPPSSRAIHHTSSSSSRALKLSSSLSTAKFRHPTVAQQDSSSGIRSFLPVAVFTRPLTPFPPPQILELIHVISGILPFSVGVTEDLFFPLGVCSRRRTASELGQPRYWMWSMVSIWAWPILPGLLSQTPAVLLSSPTIKPSPPSRRTQSCIVPLKEKLGLRRLGLPLHGPLTFSCWPIYKRDGPLCSTFRPRSDLMFHLVNLIFGLRRHINIFGRGLLVLLMSHSTQNLINLVLTAFNHCHGKTIRSLCCGSNQSPIWLWSVSLTLLLCPITLRFRYLGSDGRGHCSNLISTSLLWLSDSSFGTMVHDISQVFSTKCIHSRFLGIVDPTPSRFWCGSGQHLVLPSLIKLISYAVSSQNHLQICIEKLLLQPSSLTERTVLAYLPWLPDSLLLRPKWIVPVHVLSPLMAEALAVVNALSSARARGWQRIWIESDSQKLVRAISSKSPVKEIYGLLSDIDHLSSFYLEFSISFVPRVRIQNADILAKEALRACNELMG